MTDVVTSINPSRQVTITGGQRNPSAGSRKSRNGTPDDKKRVPSGIQRWKRQHEQSMMEKLIGLRNDKKELTKISREQATNIARKIPTEILARDWLNVTEATLETRAFVVDKILPTLILGVEKLLNEAEKKGLTGGNDERDANFNPINFLAQYLMRNNPRYSNFSESSPYVRSLREVMEDLKKELFNIEDNRLAKIKSEAKKRRDERERLEALKIKERLRRTTKLQEQFDSWRVQNEQRVELSLVQNALRSFVELSEKFPEDVQELAQLGHPLEATDESGRTLLMKEFASYVIQYIEEFPLQLFERFMLHMQKCATAYREAFRREQRRILLTNLFTSCDHSDIGLLDRHRILNLFENFWDVAGENAKKKLNNPRKWPVVEVHEADDTLSDDEEDQGPSKEPTEVVIQETKPPTPPASDQEPKQKEPKEGQEEPAAVRVKEETTGQVQEGEVSKEAPPPEAGDMAEEAEPSQTGEVTEQKESDLAADSEQTKAEEPQEKTEETGQAAETEEKPAEEEKVVEQEPTEEKQDESAPVDMKEGGTSTDAAPLQQDQQQEPAGQGEQDEPQEQTDTAVSSAGKSKEELDADVALTGDLMQTDPETSGVDALPTVSFAEGTSFEKERSLTAMTVMSRSHSQISLFDEYAVNVSQFVQLIETFLGDAVLDETFDTLKSFIKAEYQETEEEKMERMAKARKEAMSSRRRTMLDQLFEKWDNDGSGYLDQDEVEGVMMKYKDGQELENIEKAKEEMKQKSKHPQDNRLSKREFRQFVTLVGEAMPGADSFDYFIEFLNNSVEQNSVTLSRTYAERIRGEARKKWLQQIIQAADTGGANIEPVYKAVFQALYKDVESHGASKNISANIAMLERNPNPERGDVCLRYVAATTEDADFLLNQILYRDMPGISFSAVDTGKPIHVPRVANHGNIQFWNPYRHPDEREGSFIVIPLKDRRKRVFGLLGVDTLNDPHTKSIFITHEIQFYQGVAKSFSIAYHNIDMRKKLLRITESAVSWIHRRSPHVKEIITYMVEPDENSGDYVLRKMMTTDKKGNIQSFPNPLRLERKDNLFRDYLFKAVDNSESVSADAYGDRHLAFPLRNDQGRAVAIVDISLGEIKQLPSHENREVQRMLRLLQMAHKEITKEMAGEDKNVVLEAEKDEEVRMDIMFDRLMLMELRENVTKINSKAFAELRSYNDPPRIVHDILKAVCAIFDLEEMENGAYDDWTLMKNQINNDLLQKIAVYDPTAGQELIQPAKIEKYLKDVPHGEVAKHSSVPAQHMYNWVFVCLSLIEHTLKMRENNNDDILPSSSSSNKKEKDASAPAPEDFQVADLGDEGPGTQEQTTE